MAKTVWALASALVSATLFLTGCCTTKSSQRYNACCDNVVKQVPIISCQPLDVDDAVPEQPAYFYTEAQGKDLTYQWFFIGGGVTDVPKQLDWPTAQQPLLEIPKVGPTHYGLYYCLVTSTAPGGRVTHTRQASLGGPATLRAGGTFAVVQNNVVHVGTTTVCTNVSVGPKRVLLGNQTPNVPPVTPPDNGFRGNLWKVVGGVTNVIPRADYALQFLCTSADKSCGLPVPNSTTEEVSCGLTPGRAYAITVFFKGTGPTTGTQIILKGSWTQSGP